MITTLLFDLDDTLLDFQLSEKLSVKAALEQFGLPAGDAVAQRYSELNMAHWKMLERGEITLMQVKLRRFEVLFAELGVTADPEEVMPVYEKLLSAAHYTMSGAEELLRELYGKYDLYVLSNGTGHVQRRRLRESGIEPYLKGFFISGEIGVNKPDKGFFDYCFARMDGVKRENCLMIGDSLTSDMKGGRNAGIETVWFNPRGLKNESDVSPDHEIRRLSELPALLEKRNLEIMESI